MESISLKTPALGQISVIAIFRQPSRPTLPRRHLLPYATCLYAGGEEGADDAEKHSPDPTVTR
jgi:hypothetical protein